MATPSPTRPEHRSSSAALESKQLLADAERLLKEKNLQASEAAFGKVITLGVDAGQGFYGLGVIQFSRGLYADAAAMFQGCLRLDPKNANAYYYLGESWERQGLRGAAVAFFEKAASIDPGHLGASQKLSGYAATGRAPGVQQQSTEPFQHSAVAPTRASDDVAGVYEHFRNDNSPLAKQILQLIDSIKLVSVRPRLSAYAGEVLIRPALCFCALIAVAIIISNNANNVRRAIGVIPARQLFELLIALAYILPIAMCVYAVLKVKTTKYTLDNGRLVIATGIFGKQSPNHELYKVEDIELHQTFLNRLTGDGELILHITSGDTRGRPVSLRGLGKIGELQALFDKLRNLIVLLRSGTLGKGIIR